MAFSLSIILASTALLVAEALRLRQQSQELVDEAKELREEHNDILLFDVRDVKEWRDTRKK